jgi:hypothetical protein
MKLKKKEAKIINDLVRGEIRQWKKEILGTKTPRSFMGLKSIIKKVGK